MKYWKALMAATLLLGLSACGGGDDSDKNDPPPPTPGEPGSVVFTAKAPDFVFVKDPADPTKEVEKLAVDFTLKDANGNSVALGDTVMSFAVTKLMPPRPNSGTDGSFWKSFIYSSDCTTAQNPGTSAKANFEKADGTCGTVEDLGNGNYRYVFGTDVKNVIDPFPADSADNGTLIAWDEALTHRLAVTFGSNDEGSTMALVNYTLDWVPSGAADAATRNMVELDNCSDCHMDQPLHHSSRNDPKVCVACHNESNPTYTKRRPLAVLVHDVHGDLAGNEFPQDPRNCDTCHKDATPTTQDADNWFMVLPEKTCKACHTGSTMAADGIEAHAAVDPLYPSYSKSCSGSSCHSDSETNAADVKNAHLGRLGALKAARDTLVIDIQRASYDGVTKTIAVELNIAKDGVGLSTIDELLPFTYFPTGPALLVNWDNGEGDEISYSRNEIGLGEHCDPQGSGNFICTSKKQTKEPAADAVLTVTITDFGLCGKHTALDKPGGVAALVNCPSDGMTPTFFGEQAVPANVPVKRFDRGGNPIHDAETRVGAEQALCENCHKDFNIHFSGAEGGAYDHAARDFAQCTSCHNATRASFYPGIPADLKYHVHSYHGFGAHRAGSDAAPFPGKLENCESCHNQEQYNLPNQQNARPSLTGQWKDAGEDGVIGTNPDTGKNDDTYVYKYYSPTLVVCSSCHIKDALGNADLSGADMAVDHMKTYGAIFGATTAEEATGTEQCADCHAAGQEKGVDKVHNVYDFR